MTRIEIQATLHEHKKRLDDFLFDRFTDLSRMYLRETVKMQQCEVNGRFENIGYKMRPNDFVEISVDMSRGTAMRPEKIDLAVVFEDANLIVIDKPAGMLVHPTHRDKSGTLLNALSYYLNHSGSKPAASAGGRESIPTQAGISFGAAPRAYPGGSDFIRPGLIHRLDKQTSGLIVVAKNVRTHRILASHFQKKLVRKRYTALVDGIVESDEGSISGEIGRFPEEKRWGLKNDGKPSETNFRVLDRYRDSTLLVLEPVTGRTNQLRIHCESIGHPIVGDAARGGREFSRLCLHASGLSFRNPCTGIRLSFTTPVPAEFGTITD